MRRLTIVLAVLVAASATGCRGDDLPADASFCDVARRYEPALDDAFSGRDTATLGDELAAATGALRALRERAPEEIEAEVGVVVDGFLGYLHAVEAAGFDGSRVQPEQLAGLDSPAFTAASRRVAAYNRDVCGLDPGVQG